MPNRFYFFTSGLVIGLLSLALLMSNYYWVKTLALARKQQQALRQALVVLVDCETALNSCVELLEASPSVSPLFTPEQIVSKEMVR